VLDKLKLRFEQVFTPIQLDGALGPHDAVEQR